MHGCTLHYIHTEPMPSAAANTVQVAKMCAAFQSCGAEVTLTSTAVPSVAALAHHYGLDTPFGLRAIAMLPIPGKALLYGLMAVVGPGAPRRALIYTRAVSVATVASALGRPVALEMHLPATDYRPAIQRRMARLFDAGKRVLLVVISQRLADDYLRRFPSLQGRVVVAHDGADVPGPARADPVPLPGAFKVGYVGHLYPGKGMEVIEAVAPLCPETTFHIVGGRDDDVRSWRARMAAVPNVVFHGHVPHAAAAAYVAAMDVVVAPYLNVVNGVGSTSNLADWMSPLKIFEYMSQARAIVASDLPVLREVLTDGRNALLRRPDDPAGWAAAVAALQADPALRQRLGAQARQDFLAGHTWAQRAKAILQATIHLGGVDRPSTRKAEGTT